MAIYNIPEYRIAELERKLATISRKCAKYGNEFLYKKGIPFFDTVTIDGKKVTTKFFPIEVNGTAKIENWEFIATLECHVSGNVIKRYNTEIDIPERFRTSKNVCEHCQSLRYRKKLYIIHNTETNEFKQVGGNCLLSYTDGLSAEYVAMYCSAIQLLEDDYTRDPDISILSFTSYYDVKEILSVSLEVIRQLGYRKADDKHSTKEVVKSYESNGKEYTERKYALTLDDKAIHSKDNYGTVENIIAYYSNLENKSEFVHNVKVILSEKYCDASNIGMLAYLPFGYKKDMEKKQAKDEYNNAFFGEVGSRYKNIIVNVSLITSYETEYGITHIYKLIDTEKHVLIWKTTNSFECGSYMAAATVKKHSYYNGLKQTEVTRCKLIKR